MKKLTISGLALVLLLASGTAWAGGESGLYLGGSIGSAGIEVSDGSAQYSDNATAYKIFGGYNFGIIPLINLAIEGSYVDFGTARESVSGSYVDMSVTGWICLGSSGSTWGRFLCLEKSARFFGTASRPRGTTQEPIPPTA